MDSWPTAEFADLLATPLRSGINAPSRVRGSGVKLVNMGELFAHDRIGDLPMELAPLPGDDPERYLLREGDLLFARQSLKLEGAGRCCLVLSSQEPRSWEGHIIRARLDPTTSVGDFYYYWFRSPAGRAAITSIVEQVAAAGIRGSDLARLRVPQPPLEYQREVAGLLSSFDKKIESNRRLADLAWEYAAAEWRAVSVHCNRAVRLGDVTEINPVKIKPAEPTRRVEYIDIASVSTRKVDSTLVTTWSEAPGRARRGVRDGDLIFSTVRPNRRSLALLIDPPDDCVVSTGFAVIRAGEQVGPSTVAAIADSLAFSEYLTSMTEGSAYPAVSPAAMAAYVVALPPADVIRGYEDRTMPLRRRAAQADLESSLLAQLRDTLLLALMSGRLRVPMVEELVEAAT